MNIKIEIGPELSRAVNELSAEGKAIRAAASAGLQEGGLLATGNVIGNYLRGQALKMRSGLLAKTLTAWMEGEFTVVMGIPDDSPVDDYKYLLGDEQMTITPKNGKYLAIPIGENLTNTGIARYSSPRQVEGGFFVRKGEQLLFGYKVGKKGKFRPLFTLVKSVLVQGSGALIDGVLESQDDMAAAIEQNINNALAPS